METAPGNFAIVDYIATIGVRLAVVGVKIGIEYLRAYNLTVAGLHTYYAGADSVLVHNAGCDEWAAAFAEKNGGDVRTFTGPGG